MRPEETDVQRGRGARGALEGERGRGGVRVRGPRGRQVRLGRAEGPSRRLRRQAERRLRLGLEEGGRRRVRRVRAVRRGPGREDEGDRGRRGGPGGESRRRRGRRQAVGAGRARLGAGHFLGRLLRPRGAAAEGRRRGRGLHRGRDGWHSSRARHRDSLVLSRRHGAPTRLRSLRRRPADEGDGAPRPRAALELDAGRDSPRRRAPQVARARRRLDALGLRRRPRRHRPPTLHRGSRPPRARHRDRQAGPRRRQRALPDQQVPQHLRFWRLHRRPHARPQGRGGGHRRRRAHRRLRGTRQLRRHPGRHLHPP
mmetsp:Transcript_22325/g.69927  ORF Transcript_22325/g.69927 Transcript_22325/m.69927 type:complete len:312 (-) Transcript_22325:872-1807(-)